MHTCRNRNRQGTSAYSGLNTEDTHRRLRHAAGARGSLTLEAAMSLPFFLFFLMTVMSFLLMLHVQMHVQSSMEDASRRIGKSAYMLARAEDGRNIADSTDVDHETRSLMQAGINGVTIRLLLLSDSGLGTVLDSSRVRGGAAGLYTSASAYHPENGILDMVVSYDYQVPYLSGFWGSIRLAHRCRSHVWTGDPLKKSGLSDGAETKKVYVTPTGTVYHTSPDCHYLDLSIRSVSTFQVDSLRNASGARYYACEECARNGAGGTVYITDYGTSYHTALGCSKLKRTVQEVSLEEAEGLRICSKCAQNLPHSH